MRQRSRWIYVYIKFPRSTQMIHSWFLLFQKHLAKNKTTHGKNQKYINVTLSFKSMMRAICYFALFVAVFFFVKSTMEFTYRIDTGYSAKQPKSTMWKYSMIYVNKNVFISFFWFLTFLIFFSCFLCNFFFFFCKRTNFALFFSLSDLFFAKYLYLKRKKNHWHSLYFFTWIF